MVDFITAVLSSTIRQGVPILFPAMAETVAERAGVMNIGLEGNMVIGAFVTMYVYQITQSLLLAIVAGAIAGGISAIVIAYIGVSRNQPQAVVGFMFNIFASGLTAYLYRALYAMKGIRPKVPLLTSIEIPLLSKIPVLGQSLFSMDVVAWISILFTLAAGFILYRTKLGLQLRSLGENPRAAQSYGIDVIGYRWGAVIFTGIMAGLGGAYLVVGITGSFSADISAGRGFLALAVCLLCGWHPVYAMIGAFGYGMINALQLRLQAMNVDCPYQLLLALPYIVAIMSLLLAGRNKRGPRTVGGIFEREGR
ncbi:MAG: ABC transporter permease [Eubacteriales bacterium]|nr:ABC transporter permease [Eubacteriales bacterium]